MNSRPKQPKYARNKNILVIGGSGSGKTRFFVKPNLMQMHLAGLSGQLHSHRSEGHAAWWNAGKMLEKERVCRSSR